MRIAERPTRFADAVQLSTTAFLCRRAPGAHPGYRLETYHVGLLRVVAGARLLFAFSLLLLCGGSVSRTSILSFLHALDLLTDTLSSYTFTHTHTSGGKESFL